MSTEEFKMLMEMLQGLTNGATTAGIIFIVGYFFTPLLKYSIIGVAVYKVVQLFTKKIKVEVKEK